MMDAEETPKTTFHRLPDGTWGVAGPPDQVQLGAVVAHRKDGRTETVTVHRLGRTGSTREGVKFRIGYLEPLVLEPEVVLKELAAVSAQTARACHVLDKLTRKLEKLTEKIERWK